MYICMPSFQEATSSKTKSQHVTIIFKPRIPANRRLVVANICILQRMAIKEGEASAATSKWFKSQLHTIS